MELFSLPIFPYHHAQSPNLHGHSKGREVKDIFCDPGKKHFPQERRNGKKREKIREKAIKRPGVALVIQL